MAIKIYIDQGHNPQNPNAGAEGNGLREQDLVYTIGQETAARFRAQGYDVRLSRPTPETQLGTSNATSLASRVGEANSWGADYFISLHTNASEITSASGSEALVYRTDSVAGRLGASLLEGLSAATGLPNRGVIPRPNLFVLRRTRMPAVLLELGFITNPSDAALLSTQPQLFAQGIVNGFNQFIGTATPTVANVETRDAQQTDDERISYAQFLSENPYTGYLKVQAFRGEQAFPVPDVRVRISRDFTDGERTFFEGVTDQNGIIDGITLPAPSAENSLTPNGPVNTAVYTLTADHPSYRAIRIPFAIYEGITAIQPLQLLLETEGGTPNGNRANT